MRDEYDEFWGLVLSVPDRLANHFGRVSRRRALSPSGVIRVLCSALAEWGCGAGLLGAAALEGSAACALARKLVRRGGAGELVAALMRGLTPSFLEGRPCPATATGVLACLPDHDLKTTLLAVLESSQVLARLGRRALDLVLWLGVGERAVSACSELLAAGKMSAVAVAVAVRTVCYPRSDTGTVHATRKPMRALQPVEHPLLFRSDSCAGEDRSGWAREDRAAAVAARVLAVWSGPAFVAHADLPKQMAVTYAVLCLLHFLTEEDVAAGQQLLSGVLTGVQQRMGLAQHNLRYLGLCVAEAFARTAAGQTDQSLDFDTPPEQGFVEYLAATESLSADPVPAVAGEGKVEEEDVGEGEEEEEEEEAEVIAEGGEEDEADEPSGALVLPLRAPEVTTVTPRASRGAKGSRAGLPASGATAASTPTSTTTSGFKPYSLIDDEADLAPAKAPVYARVVLEGLHEREKVEVFEAALRACPGVASRGGADFDSVARDLAAALLHAEDNFSTPSFSSLKDEALVSVIVASPSVAGGYVADQIYLTNYSTGHRLDALRALGQAATRLAKVGKTAKANAFAPHAPLLFFKVLKKVDRAESIGLMMLPPRSSLDQAAGDEDQGLDPATSSYLLAAVVETAAVIVECTGNHPSLLSMVRPLEEVALVTRLHNHAHVRRAALFAYSRLCMALPPAVFADALGGQAVVDDITDWLKTARESDPDETARSMATACLALTLNRQQGLE
jgi:hypothetical protein